MDIVLVPGLWLDGSTWDRVTPLLEAAGHRTHPLTLPGMTADADRSIVSLRDAVDAIVTAIDACPEPVLLVGHSAGCGMAWAAVDARPEHVAHAVLVGGFPSPDGGALADGFAATDGEIPLPDFATFDDADLGDLDDALRAEFRARAIAAPERFTTDLQVLTDERRYGVPVTAVCPEYRSDDLRTWIEGGAASVQEFARIRDVTDVDLPTGHWPQFTKPAELAGIILEAAG